VEREHDATFALTVELEPGHVLAVVKQRIIAAALTCEGVHSAQVEAIAKDDPVVEVVALLKRHPLTVDQAERIVTAARERAREKEATL
jgi:hypothetical protein